jgi:hypothetical protein
MASMFTIFEAVFTYDAIRMYLAGVTLKASLPSLVLAVKSSPALKILGLFIRQWQIFFYG